MAVFGLPQLHEDDALRAVRAAAEMQEELVRINAGFEETYGVRLENRTGINTGEVVAGDVSVGHRLVTGDTVNVAARLEQNAPTMEVLLGEKTYRLVKDAVEAEAVEPLELKGKSERMPAYRLISVGHHEEGVARRLDAPMVGTRGRAGGAHGRPRAGEGHQQLSRRDRRRAGGDREVAAAQGVRRRVRGAGGPRSVPLLRGGPDVLAVGRDRARSGGHRQRRSRRRCAGEARGPARPGGERRRRSDRRGDRPLARDVCRGGDLLGRPALPRVDRGRRAPARADRRHPLGGADVPRPDPIGRHHADRRAGRARLLGAPRPLRHSSRMGRGVRPASGPRPAAAVGGRERGGGREPPRHRRPRRGGAGEDRRGGRRQPALRRADALDAPRRRDPGTRRPRAMDPDPRRRCHHRPADDPGAPVRTPRPARPDRPRRRRASRRDRPGVLPGSRRGPLAGRGAPPRRREPSEPHAPGAGAALRVELRRPGVVPLHAHPDPRGRLSRTAEANPRRPARPVHRLARACGAGSRPRVRGDPRLPPGAGLLHAPAAHAQRRAGLADRRPRERLPLLRRPPCARARRHPGGREPAATGIHAAASRPSGASAAPTRRRGGAHRAGRVRRSRGDARGGDRGGARALRPCAGGDGADPGAGAPATRSIRRR